jgi:hypothetical protein
VKTASEVDHLFLIARPKDVKTNVKSNTYNEVET